MKENDAYWPIDMESLAEAMEVSKRIKRTIVFGIQSESGDSYTAPFAHASQLLERLQIMERDNARN